MSDQKIFEVLRIAASQWTDIPRPEQIVNALRAGGFEIVPKDIPSNLNECGSRGGKPLSRAARIRMLRERANLSLDELAKLMGFKGQSSIQRYLKPGYKKGFRPEVAAKLKDAFVGLGTPPITADDVAFFDEVPKVLKD